MENQTINPITIIGLEMNSLWNNAKQNCLQIEVSLSNETADIFLLPEMFNTGFNMNVNETAETLDGFTIRWMKYFAQKKNAVISGSIAYKEESHFFNRFLWVKPNGEIEFYNKINLFSFSGEDLVFTKGNELKIVEYKGWKIALQICYDLRFPETASNKTDYDVLIYIANWPKIRINAWSSLLPARAIENQSYCIGLNRLGIDGNHWQYESSSAAYFADGLAISHPKNNLLRVVLDKENLTSHRKNYPFLKDRFA